MPLTGFSAMLTVTSAAERGVSRAAGTGTSALPFARRTADSPGDVSEITASLLSCGDAGFSEPASLTGPGLGAFDGRLESPAGFFSSRLFSESSFLDSSKSPPLITPQTNCNPGPPSMRDDSASTHWSPLAP